MPRFFTLFFILFCSFHLHAHHSVSYYFDEASLKEYTVIVEQFRFVNPHPYMLVKEESAETNSSHWHLELDNLRELVALGFDQNTFKEGDKLIVNLLSNQTQAHSFYVKSLQHKRLGFGYIHNVRHLFEL